MWKLHIGIKNFCASVKKNKSYLCWYEENPRLSVTLKGNENRILCRVQVHLCVLGEEYIYISIYVNENDTQETINLLGRELDEGKELLFILYLSV